MVKEKLNFWDDVEVVEKIKKRAKEEDRDLSNFLRTKIKKIRKIEKW